MIIDYDKYSLLIDNKRLQVISAALHYFRLPGIDVWRDRLSKLKAGGYNTVDIYFCWAYHSSEPGIYNFTDIYDIRALLDITVELGLHVIARPGPYINAEVSAGGFPTWLFNVPDIVLRNRKDGDYIYSKPYMQAVKEWYSRILPIINEYQNIIALQVENEYATNEAEPDYIQELYDMARTLGIKVPIFHNDSYCACLYSDIVNIYAFDTYPTINLQYDWHEFPHGFEILDTIESNIKPCSEDSPLFIAELQAGWFDKWKGLGYDSIRKKFEKKHINIVTKTALSQGITMFNHYMGCGGTSWGQLASSEVYTSYDFAAPVAEDGIPQENYYKAKEINYFLKAFNLTCTDIIAEEKNILSMSEENIFAKLRQDNLNNCKWLFIRNLNKEDKKLKISLDSAPDLILKAFDMKILPVGLNLFGCRIDFSSLSIFGRLEENSHEIVFFILDDNAELIVSEFDESLIHPEIKSENNNNKLKINPALNADLASCKFTKGNKTTEFIFLKEETADKTWLMESYAIIGPEFLMDYPYKAAFSKNTKINVLIINKGLQPLVIWKTKDIFINNKIYEFQLENWQAFKCAPEIDHDYDFSSWNLLEAPEKFDCISNKVYDEFIWYKGKFSNSFDRIKINAKHCYAIYINNIQVFWHDSYCYDHGKELDELKTVKIESKVFNTDKHNDITILVQNIGFDKGFENKPDLPRGILEFSTLPGRNIEWRIRGGLIPEIEEWAFEPINYLEDSSKNSCLMWICAALKLDIEQDVYAPLYLNLNNPSFDKAIIYLNGNLIGRYWKSMSPQDKFYLPKGFLKSANLISFIIWNRNTEYSDAAGQQQNHDFNNMESCVNIKIEYINSYNLIKVNDLL